MKSSARFQVLQRMDDRHEAKTKAQRASYEMRRAAVLSYEQLAAGDDLLRRVSRPLAVMPAPAVRVEAAPQILAEELARDPLAHPVAPARPQRAAKPMYVSEAELLGAAEVKAGPVETKSEAPSVKKPDALVVEPVEPEAEPRHRGSLHGGVENPVRSTLSPSQRAALKRPESRLDRNGRATYVTYTVDTPGKK